MMCWRSPLCSDAQQTLKMRNLQNTPSERVEIHLKDLFVKKCGVVWKLYNHAFKIQLGIFFSPQSMKLHSSVY